MSIQWIRLDIKKASNVAKEVDEVLKLYNSTIKLGDRKKLEELRKCIEERIYELEDFETAHDDDERHVLFDKQRLRLRRALQQYTIYNNEKKVESPKNTGTELYNTLMGNNMQNNQHTMKGMEEGIDEVGIVDSLAKNQITSSSTKEKKKSKASSPTNKNKNNIHATTRTTKNSKETGRNNEEKATTTHPWVPAGKLERNRKKKACKSQETITEYKPIYDWEKIPKFSMTSAYNNVQGGKSSVNRDSKQSQISDSLSSKDNHGAAANKVVTYEGVKYFAAPESGYYNPPSAFFQSEKEKGQPSESNPSSSLSTLDFAIILNEAEYNVVISRKRALAKKDIKHESTLNLDSPYVDKWRVDEVIYRPSSSSDTWVDPKGFNITPQL